MGHQWLRRIGRVAALAAVTCMLAVSLSGAEPADQAIDWQKARTLLQRLRKGEKLTAAEKTFLDRARRAWQKRRRSRDRRGPKVAPTHANVKYGDHERNVLDFWKAKSDKPTPLVVYIHGGGFRGGDKRSVSSQTITECRKAGVSVAAVNYRFIQSAPLPASLYDSARAIQFLRSKAEAWNIDKTRVASHGGSAGGCTSLWLAFHDDLADPKAADPVKRESSRLLCAAGTGAQSSLDIRVLRKWLGEGVLRYPRIEQIFGAKTVRDLTENPKYHKQFEESSAIRHLTRDDPPVFLSYGPNVKLTPRSSPGVVIHHAILGIRLKEAMDKLDLECVVRIRGKANKDPYEDMLDFFFQKFGIKKSK